MQLARARQNETLDALCFRVFGRTGGITEKVLGLNPQILGKSPLLAEGTSVYLPSVAPDQVREQVRLWD